MMARTIEKELRHLWLGGFADIVVGNHIISVVIIRNDVAEYYIDNDEKPHRVKMHVARWACRHHGNPPAGTFYRSFRVKLKDGTRVLVRQYI